MIHAIIDTSIFTSDPRLRQAGISTIERLSEAGLLKLHAPFIVEQEFISQRENILRESVNSLSKSIKSLSKLIPTESLSNLITEMQNQLDTHRTSIITSGTLEFQNWLERIGAERRAISESQARATMNSYFKGLAPFSSPKKRQDIPDSFLYQTIKEIAESHKGDYIFFISKDNSLKSAVSALDGLLTFENLDDCIASPPIQDALTEVDFKNNLPAIKSKITEAASLESLGRQAYELVGEKLIDENVEYEGWSNNTDEALIVGYGEGPAPIFDISRIEYYGEGKFLIPFDICVPVSILFYINKSDYYCFDDSDEGLPGVSDHNDHVFEAETEVEALVSGNLSFCVEGDFGGNDGDNISNITIDEDSAAVDSIERIEITENRLL